MSFNWNRGNRVSPNASSTTTVGTWELTEEPVMNGYVEATEWYPNEAVRSARTDLVVVGWAVDTLEMRPAERVVFFIDGVFGGSADPDVERPDIEDGLRRPPGPP